MRGRLIALAGLLGALVVAAPADAATFTVNDPGDSGPGTLRQAVADANAIAGADTIAFSAGLAPIGITTAPITVTAPVAIGDAQRDVVVRRSGGSGALLEVAAAATDVTVEGISFAGAARPIVLVAGANGGVQPPAGLRVAPRGGGGTLVSGTTTGAGEVEILRGDPATSAGALSAERFAVSGGAFSRSSSFDVPAGGVVAATFTPTGGGTSELAIARNADVTPPFLLGAVALSQTQVRVQPSEPLAPGSVQPSDFVLTMGGVARTLTAATVAADGSNVTLTSSTSWLAGEAGFVRLSAAGAVTDVAGNPNGSIDPVRVAASPGDVIEPFASSLRLSPATICLTRGSRCRRPGTLVRFIASEGGRAAFVIVRVNRRVGARSYDVKPGVNRIRFEGRIRGKKLRQGSYRLLVYLEDAVGNTTQNPPLRRFSVRRTLAPRR